MASLLKKTYCKIGVVSGVHVVRTYGSQYHCYPCSYTFNHPLDIFIHLCDHEEDGGLVPEQVFRDLENEIRCVPSKEDSYKDII